MQKWVSNCQKYLALTSKLNKNFILHNLRCLHSTGNKSSDVNVLDDFVTQLSNEKSSKWRQKQVSRKEKYDGSSVNYTSPWNLNFKNRLIHAFSFPKGLDLDIKGLSVEHVDALIAGAIENENLNDVENLTKQCISYQCCPSMKVLFKLLSIFSLRGNNKMVESLRELCSNVQKEKFKEFYELKHFVAKTVWIRGDIEKSVDLFIELYTLDRHSRTIVRRMIKHLINDTVTHRSEASTVILSKMMNKFGERFSDWYPLSFLWEYCWLSEWFCDQQLASSLFNGNPAMREILSDKLPPLCTIVLKDHQEDAVVRLLQLLLHNKIMFHYLRVIECLFVYRHKRGDLYGCHQIVKNCVSLNIKLNSDLQTNYLTLLISHGYIVNQPIEKPSTRKPVPTMPYKF